MAISDYQRERVSDVGSWYHTDYQHLDGHTPESVQYMALWAVFNALYNIADYPKVILRNVSSEEGKIKPCIRGRREKIKLRFIARRIAQDNQLVTSIIREHIEFITHLAQRNPNVKQPPGTTSIQFTHDNQNYSLNISEMHGIASLDNRVFLNNGSVLFQYYHLDLELDDNQLPKDQPRFFRQLIFMLYQLRNNIVHGGSAAFFMQKTRLSTGAMRLLDAIVRHLLDHPELLEQDGV